MQWANEPWTGELPFMDLWPPRGVPEHATKLQVMAALSKMDTGNYGVMDSRGIYGRTGLEQQETFVWWKLKSFVDGWITGQDEAEAGAFFLAIKAEWARVEALADAEQAALKATPT